MRLDFSNVEQVFTFLWAIAIGTALCLLYDILRFFVSSYKSSSIVVFFTDVFFFGVAGVVTFCFFQLFSKGTIRFYALLGEAIGFWIFRLLFSRLVRSFLKLISRLLSRLLELMTKPILWFMALSIQLADFVGNFIKVFVKKAGRWTKFIFRKIGKSGVFRSKKAKVKTHKSKKV